jgi:ankyrin repeat protein
MTRRSLLAVLAMAPAVNAQDAALVDAAARGDLSRVRALLAAGAPLEQRDARRRTALLAATQGNHEAVALELIARGADVNAQDDQQDSAFLLAGARGYTNILRATLVAGADLGSINQLRRHGADPGLPLRPRGSGARAAEDTAIDVDHVNNGSAGRRCWRR